MTYPCLLCSLGTQLLTDNFPFLFTIPNLILHDVLLSSPSVSLDKTVDDEHHHEKAVTIINDDPSNKERLQPIGAPADGHVEEVSSFK